MHRNVPAANRPNSTIFMIAPSEDPGYLRVKAVYEIDYITTTNPAGTYASLMRGYDTVGLFNFAVARQVGADWQAIPPRQLRWSWQARGRLPAMWARIWTEPPAS